jgi:hypothetical protein
LADTNGKTTVPYVPFKTFLATLDSFANFMPDQIDTSIWHTYSGGMRSQLLSAYRFLGLIKDDGAPTPELRRLADDKENRPVLLREVLKRSYTDLLKLDLSRATPNSFDAELRKYGQEGDTHRKVMAFFLGAAKFAGIPLSPLLLKRGSMTATRRKRIPLALKTKTNPEQGTVIPPTPPHNSNGPTRTIMMNNGVTLSLTTSADTFSMAKSDRQFVLELLDMLDKYEEDNAEDVSVGEADEEA